MDTIWLIALCMCLLQTPVPNVDCKPWPGCLSGGMVYSPDSSIAKYQGLPAEPVIMATAPSPHGLVLEPTEPKPIVGVLLVACRAGSFQCADNGGEFKQCARWELAEMGLTNPRFISGKCIADHY